MNYKININPKIAFCKIKDEYHILNSKGEILTLKGISVQIWDMLLENYDFDEIVKSIKNKFHDISYKLIEKDVMKVINKLIEKNILIKIYGDENKHTEIKNKYIDVVEFKGLWEKAIINTVPLKVDIELTNNCNLNCKYCYVDLANDVNIKNIDLNLMVSLIDQLKEMGTLFITLTGGECTLHPNFMDIVKYALKSNFYIRVLTNGSTLTKKQIMELDKISSKGLLGLDISIHSFREEIFDDFTKNNNLDIVFNPIVYPTINKKSNEDFYINKLEIEKLIDNNILLPRKSFCTALKSKCWIDYNGNVNVCEFIRESTGNIKNSKFKNIWNELISNINLRESLKLDKECTDCKLKENCLICPGLLNLNKNKSYFCNSAQIAHGIS
ncbi:PqqD family peptide modification chaperone [Anaerosalibacter massiliensis]|uniref:PqqD family peptide modification chaperone n=1 Tax=Anaerosalibacter massiliensis TaxID=1347392 RepID=A0A9X2MIF7_9FIRM|nr:PqqD family peptide modification chaperone [Anaerosalibacter massiliensis]MCR2044123.1 PqqD family peptide modification chaperone [Anaerosalibacter massiliensis]